MVIYDLVKNLLEDYPKLRNSDKKLIWTVWYRMGFNNGEVMTKEQFISPDLPPIESITRARRKVVENHPELEADDPVEKARRKKAEEKGTFIYREKVEGKPVKEKPKGHWDTSTGIAKWIEEK